MAESEFCFGGKIKIREREESSRGLGLWPLSRWGYQGDWEKARRRRKQVRNYVESKMAIVYSHGAVLWAVGHTGLSSKERLGFEVLTSVYRKYFNQRHWVESSRAQ